MLSYKHHYLSEKVHRPTQHMKMKPTLSVNHSCTSGKGMMRRTGPHHSLTHVESGLQRCFSLHPLFWVRRWLTLTDGWERYLLCISAIGWAEAEPASALNRSPCDVFHYNESVIAEADLGKQDTLMCDPEKALFMRVTRAVHWSAQSRRIGWQEKGVRIWLKKKELRKTEGYQVISRWLKI